MKKKLLIGYMIVIMGCTLAGCGGRTYTNEDGVRQEVSLEEINDILSYDIETHIVYYYFLRGYTGYLSPYLSKDGRYCKYENGKIIPLEKGE